MGDQRPATIAEIVPRRVHVIHARAPPGGVLLVAERVDHPVAVAKACEPLELAAGRVHEAVAPLAQPLDSRRWPVGCLGQLQAAPNHVVGCVRHRAWSSAAAASAAAFTTPAQRSSAR